MATQQFKTCLDKYKIDLDQDTLEYLNSMLEDMTLTDHEEVREATETFLVDANVNDKARNDFFKLLFSDPAFSGNKSNNNNNNNNRPVPLQPVTAAPLVVEQKEAAASDKKSDETTTKKSKRGVTSRRKQQQAEEEPELVAISQQSRFHTETLETLSKDIDLAGVQISIGQLDLLVDAHLKLKPFTRYGLVGQNGMGKSVLMRCMADNILVGLPQNLNILHISQLEDFDETTTVVQEVLSADKKAIIAIREYEALRAVIGDTAPAANSKHQQALNKVVFDIMKSRIKDRLDEANRLAIRRSGLRGREARKELIKVEKEYSDFCKLDPKAVVTADKVNDVITQVYEKIELIDTEERKGRAHKLLRGLGFTESQCEASVSMFSGGWRMRIALAKSLFMKPDVLLLDEPTNHLDLPAILWLQDYLVNDTDDMTVVVVSHDREFLNNVTDETIILKDKALRYHAGNYQDWEANTEEQRIRKQTLLDNTEKKRKKIQASIDHNLQQAKATRDDKRHGMINSRRKKLDRLGMEKTEDGKRFKVSYKAGYHFTSRDEIVVEKGVKTATIKIPEPTELRYNGPVFRVNEASFRYKGDSKNSIEPFSINIEPNARIAFIGPNGCGKTTLLNILTGKTEPTQGEVYRHTLLKIGYFSQHIVDQLDLDLSPVECMMSQHPSLSEQDCRAHFGTVGISGKVVLQKIRSLSGGQRNRIAFAMILYSRPQVLVLDEITNHLDMGTVDMLVNALADFSGALIVVSHDVWFLKQILEPPEHNDSDGSDEDEDDSAAIQQREIYTIKQGKVKKWEKGIDAYVASVLRTVRKQNT